jgi:WD40 repeat protein
MTKSRIRRLILIVIPVLLMLGCTLFESAPESEYKRSARQQLWPSEWGFPDREIVFDIKDQVASPEQRGIVGFIRPDGSGLITRTIAPDLFVSVPTWSPDGQFIAFRTGYWGPDYYHSMLHARVMSPQGKTVGWCYDEWPSGSGRVWATTEGRLVTRFVYADVEPRPDQIVLADFRSCEIVSVLFEASSLENERLESGALSSQGWLAVGRGIGENRISTSAELVVVEPGAQEGRVVGHGVAPAWSRDGEWLAFTGSDGIHVVRKDGTQLRRVVPLNTPQDQDERYIWSSDISIAAWSPDGEWLIYDRVTSNGPTIFKTRVETGEEIEIFQGGQYPHWRWDVAAGED